MEASLLRFTGQRQLAERRTGAGLVGKTQIKVRIKVNDADFLVRKRIQHPGTVAESRLVPAT